MSNANTASAVTTLDDEPKAAVSNSASPEVKNLINHHKELSGERAILTIHQDNGLDGKQPVFVGLNGTGYLIPRAIPGEVPMEVVHILRNASTRSYGRNDRGQETTSDTPRFPITVQEAEPVGEAKARRDAQILAQADKIRAAAGKTTPK